MLVRRAVATVALAGLLSTPARALAQSFTLTPAASAAAGYAASATIPSDPDVKPTTRAAPYVSLAPSFELEFETPRTLQSLQTSLVGVVPLPFTSRYIGPRFEITGRASYTARFDLSELWTLNTGAALSAIPSNPLVSSVDAYSAPVDQTIQSYNAYNLGLSAYAAFARELTPDSRVVQTTDMIYSFPYNSTTTIPTTTFSVRGAIAYTHQFALDSLTATLSSGYTHFGPVPDKTEVRDQILSELVGTWQRPLSPTLTSGVDLGVLAATGAGASSATLFQPTGGARLTYTLGIATASIGYTHGANINVFTSTLNLTDQAIVRASLPIGASGLGVSASGGYTRLTPINTNATDALNIFLADAGVTYSPPRVPRLAAIVRGTYNRQVPVADPRAGFTRLAFNVSLAFALPDTRVAQVQQIVAPVYTPTPILGSDSTPAPGVQPAPVELIEPPAESSAGGQAAGAAK